MNLFLHFGVLSGDFARRRCAVTPKRLDGGDCAPPCNTFGFAMGRALILCDVKVPATPQSHG
jgi:hypothetical protein